MVRNSKISSKLVFIFPAVVLMIGLGCAFIQDRLKVLSEQETEVPPTASLALDDSQIAFTQTSILTNVTATLPLASIEISQPSDLISIISTVEWTPSGGYTSVHPPVSGDLLATEAIHLSASQIQPPRH